ncbi:hypothetical protein BGM19_01110 [Streptomyces agglomeratus]|uniref:hypothetical protein n=1 Tax=Streptomyces agglomeratus TaxID=285458 RepID=UPI00085248F3|nr:hypothetical protein [Streptomyces agglomeratus]OEJ56842.1 hypothetical protein BGM19_01110 [Streptomyces agglomeratus]
MALTPLAIHDLTEAVLGCVCVALDRTAVDVPDQPGCPSCRACVVPGQPAWDTCDDPCSGEESGGQLTVSVARIYASTDADFPAEARVVQGVRGCMPPPVTALELVVTLLRCAPTFSEDGCPPTCDELSAASRALHVDMVTVYNALLCCLPGTEQRRRGRRFVMGVQRTIGPEGGCVGLEQRVTVALPGCGRCPGDEESP